MKSLNDTSKPVIEGISILKKNPVKKSPGDILRDAFKKGKSGEVEPLKWVGLQAERYMFISPGLADQCIPRG